MSNTPHHYQSIKILGLDEADKQRLRVAVATRLRLNGILKKKSRHLLTNKLIAFLESPESHASSELFNWLLAYGTPALITDMIHHTSSFTSAQQADLDVMRHHGIERLLPRDHISPDLQLWQSNDKPQNALICFTGNARKLNIPVQLFHCSVARHFDLIIYLRDPSQRLFTQGIPGLAKDINGLGNYLRSQVPQDCQTSIVGTSGGGYAALAVAEQLNAHRTALFSPPLNYQGTKIIGQHKGVPIQHVRLYFARQNLRDVNWANDWKNTEYRHAVRWLQTDSHGTLAYLYRSGNFDHCLSWLRADKSPPRLLRYLDKILQR